MTEPTIYRVLYREDRWIVKRDGHDHPAAWSLEVESVIDRGADLCDSLRPSKLFIHRRDSEVDEIRIYPASSFAEYQRLEGGPAL